ncbi:MAG: aldo/keto reductase [Limnochordaceae bacterium]|nr:aldo/keto reductase [Limnochordaceae bacterium]
MARRPLGKTGETLSIVGMGGIVVMNVSQEEANRTVAEAVDRGVNYFDVAPSYGNAQERLGPALQPYRDQVFLACKTAERTAAGARRELEESLRQLRTDHFDLYQLHAMTSQEDFDRATGPDGALSALVAARQEGLVRYLGFSAHSVSTALKLMDAFDFDTILFPVNWVNFFNENFGPQVLARAVEKGLGRLALKAMAKTTWQEGKPRRYQKPWYEPVDEPDLAALALRFTLSQPVTAAIPPGEPSLFRLALDIAEKFTPITPEEEEELRQRAKGLTPIFRLTA